MKMRIHATWLDGSNRELTVELNDTKQIDLIVEQIGRAVVAPVMQNEVPKTTLTPGFAYPRPC
jgi:hypothetical protein